MNWLAAEAKAALARSSASPEEDAALASARIRARGDVLCEALRCVRLVCDQPPCGAGKLAPFLQDPHDALVIEVLGAVGQWRLVEVLPDLLELFREYPGGGSTSVHAGRPDRRRPRPQVHAALIACLVALTDRRFDGPDALAEWLDESGQSRSISSRTERRERAAFPTRLIASTKAAVRRSTCFASATLRTAP